MVEVFGLGFSNRTLGYRLPEKNRMDEHYGACNWSRTGKWARELSQIAKWFARHF
jgi:hypothetical protein